MKGSQDPGLRPNTTVDAADGFLHSMVMFCGSDSCGCFAEPRGDSSAVKEAFAASVDLAPKALAVAAIASVVTPGAGPIELRGLPEKPPSRPVRVLYGVWRN